MPPPMEEIKLTPSPAITLTEQVMESSPRLNLQCRKRLFTEEAGDVPGVQELIEQFEELTTFIVPDPRVSLHPYYDNEF